MYIFKAGLSVLSDGSAKYKEKVVDMSDFNQNAKTICNSSFRLTSLIYTERFKFENPAVMEDKKCKQTKRFSLMAKGINHILSIDVKSKQRYKIKTNNIQEDDLYQIKKTELLGDISKFLPVQ